VWGNSLEVEDEAKILADILKSLPSYNSIILVGHSLGGILAKGVVARLLETNSKNVLRKIHGLLLLAAPQLGSRKSFSLLQRFSADARALSVHNKYLARVDDLISSRLDLSENSDPTTRNNIPTWALYAPGDYWVDPMSAGIGIPKDQKRSVRTGHSRMIRPDNKDDDGYRFLRTCLTTATKPRPSISTRNTDIEIREATARDLDGLQQIGSRMLGDSLRGVADPVVQRVITSHPSYVKVVVEVTSTPLERTEKLLGYAFLVPLCTAAHELMVAGELSPANFDSSHVVAPEAVPAALYIGALAANDPASRAVVLQAVRHLAGELTFKGPTVVWARPITPDGLRLAKQNGFELARTLTDGSDLFSVTLNQRR
jgi:pimeloyl-ACP methyl ester carboxylesterase